MVLTADQVMACAIRDPELMKGKNQKIFDHYVDEILPRVAGTDHWDKHNRFYHTISEAKHGDTGEFCIMPGMEAFAVLIFKNCEQKWEYLWMKKKDGEEPSKKEADDMCPYTTYKGGQVKWGGWNKEGRDLYKKLKEQAKEAREQNHVEKMETECLQRLRSKHKVEGPKKNKKKQVVVEEEESDEEF